VHGVASFAHPGVTKRDDLIAPLIDRGLDAIEVYHSDHTPEDVTEYRHLAIRLNALISGLARSLGAVQAQRESEAA